MTTLRRFTWTWNVLSAFGRITKICPYAITRFLLNESTGETLCVDITIDEQSHQDERTSKITFYPPTDEEEDD